ncbi:DUF397 domain-containing protein [Spirillospora sp. NPDC049652]
MTTLNFSAVRWRKSSRSSEQGGECVEIADLSSAQWRKSSRSSQGGQNCVEIADVSPVVAVRDSKDPEGPKLILDAAAWASLTRHVRASAG